MSRLCRLLTFALASVALLAGAAACGDSGSSIQPYPETFELPTSAATPTTTTPSPFATDFSGPNESGQAPIFWRTADDFATLKAGQPYKMLFRITNGYAEPAITVLANCLSCFGNPPPTSLSGVMVTPVGADAPGSYYPVNVLLPTAGHWELAVQAAADHVTIPVDVKAAQ